MPVILPAEVQPIMEYVTSPEVRRAAEIIPSNRYVFANQGINKRNFFNYDKRLGNNFEGRKKYMMTLKYECSTTLSNSIFCELNKDSKCTPECFVEEKRVYELSIKC